MMHIGGEIDYFSRAHTRITYFLSLLSNREERSLLSKKVVK